MMIMIVIVIGLLRTNLFGLYRHRKGLGFTWSRLQGRKYNIRIAKLAFHAKESSIRTQVEVLSLVSSRFNCPNIVHSPAVRIPPNPGLPQAPRRGSSTSQQGLPYKFLLADGPSRRTGPCPTLRRLPALCQSESYAPYHSPNNPHNLALRVLGAGYGWTP